MPSFKVTLGRPFIFPGAGSRDHFFQNKSSWYYDQAISPSEHFAPMSTQGIANVEYQMEITILAGQNESLKDVDAIRRYPYTRIIE